MESTEISRTRVDSTISALPWSNTGTPRESAQRAAQIDVNPNYDIKAHYQTCIRLARIDTDASTGTPNLREPDTALAATIGQQLKNPGRGGKGYVSDDSSIDSGSTTGSSASSGNTNPATQAYIERQKKATGKSAKEIKYSIECSKCGQKGHVGPDCRSSGGKERKQQPRNRSKNTGNRAGSIFASSLQTVDEAVDEDTYDEDQGGFVIDTAGVFCAVISDQYSDLYIDKSDLMPDLVSDDDTDSEDESLPYKSMIELSIVPTNLQAIDSKHFSYEAVSAELDRYLNGPQSIIVYFTHTALERRWRRTTL